MDSAATTTATTTTTTNTTRAGATSTTTRRWAGLWNALGELMCCSLERSWGLMGWSLERSWEPHELASGTLLGASYARR